MQHQNHPASPGLQQDFFDVLLDREAFPSTLEWACLHEPSWGSGWEAAWEDASLGFHAQTAGIICRAHANELKGAFAS